MGLFDFFKKSNKAEENDVTGSGSAEAAVEQQESGEAEAAADQSQTEPGEAEAAADQPTESDQADAAAAWQNAGQAGAAGDAEQNAKSRQELSKERDDEGKLLSYLIERHLDTRNTDSFRAVLKSFAKCWVWTPMFVQYSEEDIKGIRAAQQSGEKYEPKDQVRFVPALMQDKDGRKVIGAFTNRDEIPEAMRTKFAWVQMPSAQCVHDVITREDITALVINPGEKPLVLNNEVLLQLVNPPADSGVPKADTDAPEEQA